MICSLPPAKSSVLAKTCLVAGATHPRLAKPRLCGQLSVREDFGSPIFPSRHRRPPGAGAFTLIELLIVVSIIAILAGLTLAGLGFVNRKGAESRALTEVAALSSAIENYKLDLGFYPAPANLYNELTRGKGAVNTNKVYFEPPPGMVGTNAKLRVFVDPYGQTYKYSTTPKRNIGFFDLYCIPPDAKSEADWIHN